MLQPTLKAFAPHMNWYCSIDATTGSLTYLSYNLAEELMTVSFDGIQLLSLEHEKYEAGKDGISKVKATMTVEAIDLKKGVGNS